MAYIGRSPEYGNAVSEQITGTNSVGPYALSYDTSTSGVVISLDGVVQRNSVDFNIVGTALTFTSTVGTGIIINVVFTGLTLSFPTPSDGSVTDAKITAMAASKLTGTIADARFPATLPAISGANLTSLPSDITKSTSEPTATINPSGGVGTVYLRTTTGEMYCCTDATTNANVWTNIGDGTGLQPVSYMVATGGTITTVGNTKIHTFTTSGSFSFTVTDAGDVPQVDYLVIAGGASGAGHYGGGGGAGGYRNSYNSEASGGGASSETALTLTAQAYTVTVGAGGASVSGGTDQGVSGSNSVFATITSVGGGGGGQRATAGQTGGSGGGGGDGYSSYSAGVGGAGTADQGYAGGIGNVAYNAGGGGGASAVGGNATSSLGGAGGAGLSSSISGASVDRAGGGGGGNNLASPNATATHGGGIGGSDNVDPANGTVNTGAGGGGWGDKGGTVASGAGGSGVVIIRYQFQA